MGDYFLPTRRLCPTLSQTITWQPTSSVVHCSHLLSRDIPPERPPPDSIGMAATKTERMMLWCHGLTTIPESSSSGGKAGQGETTKEDCGGSEMIVGVLQK